MGSRLLPRDLQELYAHALALEHAAAKRFVELERYMRDAGMHHIADEFKVSARRSASSMSCSPSALTNVS